MAGLDLHRHIIERTPVSGRDQDHLRVLHASFPDMIADRTEALQGGYPQVPARGMADVLLSAEAAGRALHMPCVAGIPCNTFHAPAIWDRFTAMLEEGGSRITVLHMIETTIAHITATYPEISVIGLLSTTGTREAGIYPHAFMQAGIKVVESLDQPLVHKAVYDDQWGVKAVSPVTAKARAVFTDQIEQLQLLGAQAVILGCTEIPLAVPESIYHGIPLINPVTTLADALIAHAMA